MATMAMDGAPTVRNRVLIGPRGVVNRRNGAETALAGMADSEILCDSIARVLTLLASVASTTTRDCAEATTFNSASSENCLEVFGVVNGIDGAAELGLAHSD